MLDVSLVLGPLSIRLTLGASQYEEEPEPLDEDEPLPPLGLDLLPGTAERYTDPYPVGFMPTPGLDEKTPSYGMGR